MEEQKTADQSLELSFDREKNQIEGLLASEKFTNSISFYIKDKELIFEKSTLFDEEKEVIKEWIKKEKNPFEKQLNNYMKENELFKHVSTIEKANITSEYYRELEISGMKVVEHNLYFTLGSFECCFLFRLRPFQTKPVIHF